MEIQEIPINKIKPDPNQPRKSFDQTDIQEMAKSILTEGVINPIEVDTDFIIITGERRWRSAKEAGLTTVPCKVIPKISANERFMRQVIENIHHNTMSDWDTANALKKMIEVGFSPGEKPKQFTPKSGATKPTGISWLHERTGKSLGYISEKLDLLEASKPFQTAVRKGEIPTTNLRVLRKTPEEYRPQIEQKILSGEFRTRDAGFEVVGALKRDPEKAEEILAQDYSKYKTTSQVTEAVAQISPRYATRFAESMKPPKELGEIVSQLIDWLQKHPPESVGKFHIRRIILDLNVTKEEIDKWFKN